MFFVIGFVPETKGRDLDSIANLFLKKVDNKSNVKIEGQDEKVEKSKEKCDLSIEITRL